MYSALSRVSTDGNTPRTRRTRPASSAPSIAQRPSRGHPESQHQSPTGSRGPRSHFPPSLPLRSSCITTRTQRAPPLRSAPTPETIDLPPVRHRQSVSAATRAGKNLRCAFAFESDGPAHPQLHAALVHAHRAKSSSPDPLHARTCLKLRRPRHPRHRHVLRAENRSSTLSRTVRARCGGPPRVDRNHPSFKPGFATRQGSICRAHSLTLTHGPRTDAVRSLTQQLDGATT